MSNTSTLTLTLSSDDLFSKWGFSDGDLLYDAFLDSYMGNKTLLAESMHSFAHALLVLLVKRHLLPKCPSDDVHEICTAHNPIRFRDTVERFPEVEVVVPHMDILAAAEELAGG